mgnify:CR=1 FL=1
MEFFILIILIYLFIIGIWRDIPSSLADIDNSYVCAIIEGFSLIVIVVNRYCEALSEIYLYVREDKKNLLK